MSTPKQPRKRVSHQTRQYVTDALAAAYADGQLTTTEFDQRTSQAWAATYADEVDVLIHDLDLSGHEHLQPNLPQARPHAPLESRPDFRPDARPEVQPAFVTGEPGGVSTSIAIMSGVDRKGDWLVPSSHFSLALMGGTVINLLNARFSDAHTRINAAAVMGGIRIVVPEDVRVRSEGIALMGGFDVHDHASVTVAQQDLPPNAPTLTISGLALMGGVEIIRVARGARID